MTKGGPRDEARNQDMEGGAGAAKELEFMLSAVSSKVSSSDLCSPEITLAAS